MMKSFACLTFIMLAAITNAASSEPSSGYEDFFRYCSACHGEAADGKGPVANVLTPPPPALNNLREGYGRPLGAKLVSYVMGTTMPRAGAHGTSDMPVWGRNLKEPDGDDTESTHTIWKIVEFLESIQRE